MQLQNQPSFGMALYSPSVKTVTKKFGQEIGREYQKAIPELEQLAKDVDIKVLSEAGRDKRLHRLEMYVSKKPTDMFSSIIKKVLFPQNCFVGTVFVNNNFCNRSLSAEIVDRTKLAKNIVLNKTI